MAGMRLEGQAVVVTGAGRGIGAAMARRFAREGARVVVNDLDGSAAEEVAAEIGGHAVPGDTAGADLAARLVAEARDRLGPIDLFCANAASRRPAAPTHLTRPGHGRGRSTY